MSLIATPAVVNVRLFFSSNDYVNAKKTSQWPIKMHSNKVRPWCCLFLVKHVDVYSILRVNYTSIQTHNEYKFECAKWAEGLRLSQYQPWGVKVNITKHYTRVNNVVK